MTQSQEVPKTQKKPEFAIESEILKGVYSFHELMYRNKNRFEMIISQPSEQIQFQKVKAIFKGRFICKTNGCLQNKRNSNDRRQKGQQNEDDINGDWIKWWKKQNKIIRPQVKEQGQIENQVQDQIKLKQKSINETEKSDDNNKKKKYIPKVKQEEIPKGKEKTRWSSSLTYVIMHYYCYPESLGNLKKVYERKKNNKCEIYFYVEVMGQRCYKCQSQNFCYPFFGTTELKRIRKNLSSYIYNKIQGRPILRYKPCQLKRLKGHIKDLCQACQLGECGIRCLPQS